MSELSGNFGNCARGITPSVPTASKTMLASLSTAPTQVSVTPVDTMRVKADGAGAGALAAQNTGIAKGMKQDVGAVKADISNTICVAQAQVVVAMDLAGYDAAALYPDAMSPDSAMELLSQASLGADGMGGGSAAMALMKHTPSVAMVLDEVKGAEDKPSAEAAAEKILVAASSGPIDTREGNFGLIMNVDDTPVMQGGASMNWAAFVEQGHEISDLMALDPDNPNPDIVPEWAALDTLEANLDDVSAELAYSAAACDHMVLGSDLAPIIAVVGAGIKGVSGFDQKAAAAKLGGDDPTVDPVKEALNLEAALAEMAKSAAPTVPTGPMTVTI